MLSTMQDGPLLISGILRHGLAAYGDSEVVTVEPTGDRRSTFAQIGGRAERLAAALRRLGVADGDRVATFAWNDQEHLEAYLAVPSMGAVLHTLNIRLFPDQLAYVVNHAEDKVVIVDASVAPLLAKVRDQCPTVEHVIVVGEGDTDGLGPTLAYEEFIGAEEPGYQWPDLDERSAAAMCYTSGTTGNPKGVVYSHRSTWLHSFSGLTANALGATEQDRVLVIVPMFHANAWGMPYTAFLAGTDLILPERFLQAEPLARMIGELRLTLSLGVPTIWNDLLRYADSHEVDLSSLRMVTAGGAAVPRALMEAYRDRFGVAMVQGWGMTETVPCAPWPSPPKGVAPEEEMDWRAKTGRILAGVEVRVVDVDGSTLPADGHSVGEFEVRGPWVTGAYYGDPIRPVPRRLVADRRRRQSRPPGLHADLRPDQGRHQVRRGMDLLGRTRERGDGPPRGLRGRRHRGARSPVGRTASRGGGGRVGRARPAPDALLAFLTGRVARWWLPERWAFVDELPKTSVGKFDKKALRVLVAEGSIEILEVDMPRRGD